MVHKVSGMLGSQVQSVSSLTTYLPSSIIPEQQVLVCWGNTAAHTSHRDKYRDHIHIQRSFVRPHLQQPQTWQSVALAELSLFPCPGDCHPAEHRNSMEGSVVPAPIPPLSAQQSCLSSANTRELTAPKK